MKKTLLSISGLLLCGFTIFQAIRHFISSPPPQVSRPIAQYAIDNHQPINVLATTLPQFTYNISDKKFAQITDSEVHIVHAIKREVSLAADISIDNNKHLLVVHPKDIPNFKPGMYKLSLKLRTPEGEVNIEQDFTWGVIAVNTNKSIYKPGEQVKIGLGVLNDAGETLCLTGGKKVDDISVEITDPQGALTVLSPKTNTILDSGKCGPATVTNQADFLATYTTNNPGIYQMKVIAMVYGQTRQIQDYFKVQTEIPYDIERTSFPTRIYPPSPYPNTFTVISPTDYQGEISDVTPASFVIEHISDSGVVETTGDFNHITWQVDLKAGVPKQLTYFVKFPQVSPEFYLLGPISVNGFEEARQWQIASDAINSTSGLVSWEDNGGSFTWSRIWTGTDWNPPMPTPPTSMDTSPGDSRWFVEKSNPKTGEKLVALVDNGPDELFMFTWSGTAWSESFLITLSGTTIADNTRAFDIAYEELSGDALFVYSDYVNNQLLYRTRPRGGSWSGSSSNAGTGYDVYKRWVRLEPQFGSDSILVGYLNNNERVGAMIWDGVTFGDQFTDASGTATATSDEQAMDIAWETQSGTPMIFWGTTANALIYREFTSGTWQAEANVTTGLANDLDWVKVAADPVSSSNNISLALQDGGSCVARFGIWTGAGATMNGTTATCASVTTNNLIDTKFENISGKAMYVYIPSATNTRFAWLTWTSGDGFISATTELGATTAAIEGVQLYSDLLTTSMMLLYHDNAGDLWDRQWDGASWSSIRANAIWTAVLDAADDNTEPYGFGFDRNLETLAAYRWFTNANGTDVGTALTSQDSPYTLTTANQQFRLRLLLYYPDNLTTAAGRQYKLQYVDPGTGTCTTPTDGTPSTWTDVPTSGGTTISFYDNGSPSDGNNLTANASDPTYTRCIGTCTNVNQDYEEANNFTNSAADMPGDRPGLWDFSLIDNTTYDRVGQTYCFRVARSNDLILQIGLYPQITTAAIVDVLIRGDTQIRQGTLIR